MRNSLAVVVLLSILAATTGEGQAAPKNKRQGQGVSVSHQECVSFHTRHGMKWKKANKKCNAKKNRIPKNAAGSFEQ
jgi:hypothetical protein